jgi:hypothetical protein
VFSNAKEKGLAQEVFNKTWQYHVVEKHLSGHFERGCYYYCQDAHVRMCSIGCQLLSEDAQELQGLVYTSISSIFDRHIAKIDNPRIKSKLEEWKPIREFIEALQVFHDSHPGSYRKDLPLFAKEWGLTVPSSLLPNSLQITQSAMQKPPSFDINSLIEKRAKEIEHSADSAAKILVSLGFKEEKDGGALGRRFVPASPKAAELSICIIVDLREHTLVLSKGIYSVDRIKAWSYTDMDWNKFCELVTKLISNAERSN